MDKGLFEKGTIRNLISKYGAEESIEAYNKYIQDIIMTKLGIEPQIHILDCKKIEVKLDNKNYEK